MQRHLSSNRASIFQAWQTSNPFLFTGLQPFRQSFGFGSGPERGGLIHALPERKPQILKRRQGVGKSPSFPPQGGFMASLCRSYGVTGPCAAPQARCAGRGRRVRKVSQHICPVFRNLGVLCAH